MTLPTYNSSAIWACADLLLGKAHYERIVENIYYDDGDCCRKVSLEITLPRSESESYPETESSSDYHPDEASYETIPIVLATPAKGKSTSIVSASGPKETPLAILDRGQNSLLSQYIISELLWRAYYLWLVADPDVARRTLLDTQDKLHKLVILDRAEANDVLRDLFTDGGELKTLHSDMRPGLEKSLYKACKILAERTLVCVEMGAVLGSRCQLSFSQRSSSQTLRSEEFRYKIKGLLGGHPAYLRIHLPLVRRCMDYHLKVSSPKNSYWIHRYAVFCPSSNQDTQVEALPSYASKKGNEAYYTYSDARSEAHVFIGNGYSSRKRIDGLFILEEIPPGSSGKAFMACFLTLVVLATLSVARFLMPTIGDTVIPPLIAAIIAILPGLGSVFGASNIGNVSAWSEVLILGSIGTSFGFIIWWFSLADLDNMPIAKYLLLAILLTFSVAFTTISLIKLTRAFRRYSKAALHSPAEIGS